MRVRDPNHGNPAIPRAPRSPRPPADPRPRTLALSSAWTNATRPRSFTGSSRRPHAASRAGRSPRRDQRTAAPGLGVQGASSHQRRTQGSRTRGGTSQRRSPGPELQSPSRNGNLKSWHCRRGWESRPARAGSVGTGADVPKNMEILIFYHEVGQYVDVLHNEWINIFQTANARGYSTPAPAKGDHSRRDAEGRWGDSRPHVATGL